MNIAMNGCGRVGKALLQHWVNKNEDVKVVLIRNSTYQWRDDQGIPQSALVDFLRHGNFPEGTKEELDDVLKECPIDLWFEMTPTNLDLAQAVHADMLKILKKGISIVFANKAPVLHDYCGLKKTGDQHKALLGLSAVMGASLPSFALGYYGSMGSNILSMSGILNGTTNFVLEEMEQGKTFQEALDKAMEIGIAEPNWAYDIDGIDSGIKMSILASVLTEKNIELDKSKVKGIRDLSLQEVEKLKKKGQRLKLVARYQDGVVSVSPEIFRQDQYFYHVRGAEKILSIETDSLSEMSVIGGKSGLAEVAASMHRDLCWIIEKKQL